MKRETSTMQLRRVAVAIAVSTAVIGCAPRTPAVPQPVAPTAGGLAITAAPQHTDNLARLDRLTKQRRTQQSQGDYVLGEGDLISVRAYDLEDLNHKVRVENDGSVNLPLLNRVSVAGRTVAEVQNDLTKRLGAYMFNPHVTVFVEEYRSQQVAVEGAVQRPGLVSQTVRNATVRDVLSAAGGILPTAGSRLYLIPAETRVQVEARQLPPAANGAPSTDTTYSAEGIMIDTAESDATVQQAFFNMPVRSGDVIVVPASGNFIADGWVAKPGTYPLRSGLTLRGALATAGGLSFPADKASIRIFQAGVNGTLSVRDVNYADIEAMKVPDVLIHDGDVVQVASTTVKLVPYSFYKFLTEIIRVGMRVTPI
jgi:polysaccharide export outer membrane protein